MAATARRRKSPKPARCLPALQWAPFRPSSDAQLYPIRQLEISKNMLKVKQDDKLSDADKKAQLDKLQADLDKISALAQKTPSM